MVAASISAASKIDVATSALHSRQYFSLCPGRSNKSACRPQEEHCDAETAGALPFGPNNIEFPPLNGSLEPQHPQEPILGKSIQEKLSVPLGIRKGERVSAPEVSPDGEMRLESSHFRTARTGS